MVPEDPRLPNKKALVLCRWGTLEDSRFLGGCHPGYSFRIKSISQVWFIRTINTFTVGTAGRSLMSKLYKHFTPDVSVRNAFVTGKIKVELVQETVRLVMDAYDPDRPVSIYDAVINLLSAEMNSADSRE